MKKFKLISTALSAATILGTSSVFLSSCSCNVSIVELSEDVSKLGVKVQSFDIQKGKESTITFEIPSGKKLMKVVVSIDDANGDVELSGSAINDNKVTIPADKMTSNKVTVKSVILGDSSKDNELAKEIVSKAIEEFTELAKVPRPSRYTGLIRQYLIQRIKDLGYEPKTDWQDPEDLTESANVWFDVPASQGYENYKGTYLQAHMDMVIAGMTEEESKNNGIKVEYHEDTKTLTSEGKKTSLGADDGIGIGLIFSLIQNTQIKHGPLTIIFTADEEDGMGGAKRLANQYPQIKSTVLDKYDNLINIDGELDKDGYYRSCQGSVGYNCRKDFDEYDKPTARPFNVFISGFKGGHSGNDINKGRCNATVFIMSVLKKLNDDNLQIQKYTHEVFDEESQTYKDLPFKRTSIPTYGRVYFISSKTEEQIKTAFEETKNDYKNKYTGEDWDKVKIEEISQADEASQVNVLTKEDTNKVISLLTDEEKGLKYGVYVLDPETNRPLQSCNICPLSITDNANTTKMQLNLQLYGRAVYKTGINELIELLPERWNNFFDDSPLIPSNAEFYYPWEIKEDDKIQKLAHEAYQTIAIEPYIRDTNGGVEPLWFATYKPTLQQTCLGTKFEGVHSVNETCYLEPLINTVKVIKYMFENLK